MQSFVSLTSEIRRIKELLSFHILDTPNEREFDNLVRLAAQTFKIPVAAITFLDEKRQWIKASVGLNVCETDRKYAVCNYTIRQYSITEIPDMSLDEHFSDFPFVAGEPFFRYYIGIPLKTERGYLIGVICLIDTRPRILSDDEKDLLYAFSRTAMTLVEISSKKGELAKINEVRERICCTIRRNEKDSMLSKAMLNLQEDCSATFLSVDGLIELSDLLKEEADNTARLLNEMEQSRRLELQDAVNKLKGSDLRQLVNSQIREMEEESTLK